MVNPFLTDGVTDIQAIHDAVSNPNSDTATLVSALEALNHAMETEAIINLRDRCVARISPLTSLPQEVIGKILSYLPTRDIASFGATSSAYRNIALDTLFSAIDSCLERVERTFPEKYSSQIHACTHSMREKPTESPFAFFQFLETMDSDDFEKLKSETRNSEMKEMLGHAADFRRVLATTPLFSRSKALEKFALELAESGNFLLAKRAALLITDLALNESVILGYFARLRNIASKCAEHGDVLTALSIIHTISDFLQKSAALKDLGLLCAERKDFKSAQTLALEIKKIALQSPDTSGVA